jgi:hypothetical protein
VFQLNTEALPRRYPAAAAWGILGYMFRWASVPSVVFVCTWLVGCGPSAGTDVGNGRTGFNLQGYEQVDGAAAPSTSEGITLSTGVVVESLYMVVDKIRLVPGTNCSEDDGAEFDLAGPLVANLVGAGVFGGVPQFETAVGSFCEFEMDFHRLEADDTVPAASPDALVDRSILMYGTTLSGDRFTVESELNEEFKLDAKDGAFTLDASQHSLVLAFEIGSWVASLDLDTLGPGDIAINSSDNQDRLNDFEDAVKRSAKLFRDGDKDGELDENERADGEELAD